MGHLLEKLYSHSYSKFKIHILVEEVTRIDLSGVTLKSDKN